MPWWDYWVPLACIKSGLNLYHIKDELIYHITHQTNYDKDIWLEFAKCLYDDIVVNTFNKNIRLEEFMMGDEGEQMDIKKFIEYKQINVSII